MTTNEAKTIKPGSILIYNDGRAGRTEQAFPEPATRRHPRANISRHRRSNGRSMEQSFTPVQDVKIPQTPTGATRFQDSKNPVHPANPVSKPRKIIVPFAEARHWRAGGDYMLTQKMDGRFEAREVLCPESRVLGLLAGERMANGEFWAFDILTHSGQDVRGLPMRERWRLLTQDFRHKTQDFSGIVPTGLGGEWVEHILANGGEGVCAKHLDAPYGEMFVCKRVQVYYCIVIAKDASTGSVELASSGWRLADGEFPQTPDPKPQTRGWMPLRGNKFESVRVGSVLKVEAFGLTESGKLREARPDKDTPTSWLVKF